MEHLRYRAIRHPAETEVAPVAAVLERHGWRRTDGDGWHLLWSFGVPPTSQYAGVGPGRRVNHFPGAYSLHFKDELHHFVAAAGSGDVTPRTFSMPGEYATWRAVAEAEPATIWARKPKRLSGGIGIRLFTGADGIGPEPGWIVQEYVADPLLLPGHPYKHVLRLYVAVTSLDPLTAYLHAGGPAKFTSRPFGTSPEQLADLVAHVTNPGVQRTNTDVPDPFRTIPMAEYRERLRAAGIDDGSLWDRLRDVLARTLIAHREPMLRVSRYVCDGLDGCFELLGFDVLVDARLRPWVIECNVSPALGARGAPGSPTHAAQRQAKETVAADLLALVGLVEEDRPNGFAELVAAGAPVTAAAAS